MPTSLVTLKASWSPSAGSAQLVASANPAFRQYQPANTDLLDSGYPRSSAYHASSPQPLDPFFDDEDDMRDSAVVRPIPMQSTESHLPVVVDSYAARLRSVARPGSAQHWCGGDSACAAVPRRSCGCDGRPRSRVTIFRIREMARCWRSLRMPSRRSRM